jgi:hypothetical protein
MNRLQERPTPTLSDTEDIRPHAVSLQDVSDHIRLQPQATTHVVLSVSPCRSGTTILLRVFGYSGVQAHFQQMKNILRWLMIGRNFDWCLPHGSDLVLLKETLGPFTDAECRFNPLQALLGAGFPQEKLHLLIIGREPVQTWASWDAWWGQKTDVTRCITAFRTTEHVRKQAQELRIPSTNLVYEAFRDHPVEVVVQRLFRRLAIVYTPFAIGNWETLPGCGMPGSNIILPREPPTFVTRGIHDKPMRSTRLAYVHRRTDAGVLKECDMVRISDSGIFDIYRTWVSACEKDLQLKV